MKSTSLVPLDSVLLEISAFIIVFFFTVCIATNRPESGGRVQNFILLSH